MRTAESAFQTLFKVVVSALAGLCLMVGIVTILFVSYLHISGVPGADIRLPGVARDTMFSVGKERGEDRAGGYLSIRLTGEINDSTSLVSVLYPQGDPAIAMQCRLPGGKFDQVWSGDYYDGKANLVFFHKKATQGKLRLQVVFSTPPDSWGFVAKNGRWVKEGFPIND
jgi:hypothetical protein